MKTHSIGMASLLCLGIFAVTGCTIEGNAKYSGSGELPSSGGTGKAYLTVNADTCDGNENAKGAFSYTDKTAVDWSATGGVSATGTIQKAGICTSGDINNPPADGNYVGDCECAGWPAVLGTYTSTNPLSPGGGQYYACFYSQREGQMDGNSTTSRSTLVQRVRFIDGPYADYENHGTLRGNITSKTCGT